MVSAPVIFRQDRETLSAIAARLSASSNPPSQLQTFALTQQPAMALWLIQATFPVQAWCLDAYMWHLIATLAGLCPPLDPCNFSNRGFLQSFWEGRAVTKC